MNSRLPFCLILVFAALILGTVAPRPALPAPRRDPPLKPKVLILTYNPIIEAEGGKRLSEVCGWKDPAALTQTYLADVRECSGEFVQYQVVDHQILDAFPLKKDGFRYTDESYMQAFRAGKGWHQPGRRG